MTERIDSFIDPNGNRVTVRIGVFRIKNGLISEWRDYSTWQPSSGNLPDQVAEPRAAGNAR